MDGGDDGTGDGGGMGGVTSTGSATMRPLAMDGNRLANALVSELDDLKKLLERFAERAAAHFERRRKLPKPSVAARQASIHGAGYVVGFNSVLPSRAHVMMR